MPELRPPSVDAAPTTGAGAGAASVPRAERAEAAVSTPCTILHLDMDAFFAAIEVLDDPSLAGLPVIVGGDGPRGAVASCSYEARAHGVRSAMASVEARRRCPSAVFRPGRYARYAEVSSRLGALLRDVTPLVEPIGLDEAFLDVSGALRRLGTPLDIARALREQVQSQLHLTCAVGVARTKSLAKLASRRAKAVAPGDRGPGDGIVVVPPEGEAGFLLPLPVGALWGVGPATTERLAAVGIGSVGDLAALPAAILERLVGRAAGRHLAALAAGRDTDRVQPDRPVRSIGRETTLAADAHDRGALVGLLAELATDVGQRLARRSMTGRSVTVKVRFGDRRTITRSTTVDVPVDGPHQVLAAARSLLAEVDPTGGIRLLGVTVSQLAPASELAVQLPLGGDAWSYPDGRPSRGEPTSSDDGRSSREQRSGDPGRSTGERGLPGGPGLPGEAGMPGGPSAGSSAPTPAARRGSGSGERWRQVDGAVVALRERFGPGAVVPAVVIDPQPEPEAR